MFRRSLPVLVRALTGASSGGPTTSRAVGGAVYRCAFSVDAAADAKAKANGWGQTRVHELLDAKGADRGAWLWCSKDDKVIDAVRKMTKGNVGSLLVFDPTKAGSATGPASAPADAVVGIVTERDYLTKVVVQGKQSTALDVSEIMTSRSKLLTVPPTASVVDVMGVMTEANIRHVPVVDGGQFLGMVSIRDVVTTLVEEHREEVGRLQEYIAGGY